MNYLQLCQELRKQVGVTGTGPAAVTSQTGQLLKLVDWVKDAWVEIQSMRPDWKFMWKEFSFDTTADLRDYPPADVSITDLDEWDTGSFLIYKTATGVSDQGKLPFKEYRDWREQYRAQMTSRDSNRPSLFTIMPDDQAVRFEAVPDAIYTIEGEYKRTPQVFSANTDEPTGLASQFHMMIVYKAMEYYGFHEDAPEVLGQGERLFDQWLTLLENRYLPKLRIGADPVA